MITLKDKDIWSSEFDNHYRCIPTNVGWDSNGLNIMGAGLAKQAKARYPQLPQIYGSHCQAWGSNICTVETCKIILLPSKPLNEEFPHLSWKYDSDLDLIKESYESLGKVFTNELIVTPLLGVGLGHIDKVLVFNVAKSLNLPDNVTLLI